MADAQRPPRVLVIGSINFDRSYHVESLPRAGETIHSRAAQTGLGGKGANQAIAASLLGAAVSLLAAVCADAGASPSYFQNLTPDQVF